MEGVRKFIEERMGQDLLGLVSVGHCAKISTWTKCEWEGYDKS